MSVSVVLPILKRHRPFAIVSSIGLALLYAEEGWAASNFWARRPSGESLAIILALTIIVFIGYLISFLAPAAMVNETWNYPRPWGIVSTVATYSVGITIAVNVIAFALLIFLTNFNLVAMYNLVRDVYIYMLVAILFFHGLLLYVRYMAWLYMNPGFVQPAKVIAASVGIGVLIFVVAGFLFSLDLHALDRATPAQEGVLGLHVYLRLFYLLTLTLGAYAWHLRWIADH